MTIGGTLLRLTFGDVCWPCWQNSLITSPEPELLSDVSDSVVLSSEGVRARGTGWEETP